METIRISIDEKACVGCSLCVDVCPTEVFTYSEADALPLVSKAKECFGCLSCSEICPATAISHQSYPRSESYYHDVYTVALGEKMGTTDRTFNRPSDDAHITHAMRDLGIRLLSVSAVLKETLGQSLPSVGTMAGMSLAAQLPRYQQPESFEEALALIRQTFAPAWDLTCALVGDELTITINHCFVRSLCQQEKLAIGGDICILFYNYLAGYFSKICIKRPRLISADRGDAQCIYHVKLYGKTS